MDRDERTYEPPEWEPEPLHLPLILPPGPAGREQDEDGATNEGGRSPIVIDLA